MATTRQEAKQAWEQIKDPDAHGVNDDEANKTFVYLAEELIDLYAEGRCACCQNNRPSGQCP